MSDFGTKRTCDAATAISALGDKADIADITWRVRIAQTDCLLVIHRDGLVSHSQIVRCVFLFALNACWIILILLFRLIDAHVAKLRRSFDKAVLSARAFLIGCCFVTELVDRPTRHLGRLAPAAGSDRPNRGDTEGLSD
jgi:hypothetical protein